MLDACATRPYQLAITLRHHNHRVGTLARKRGGVQMSRQSLLRTAGIFAATLLLSTLVFAQAGQVEGTVKLKAADGSVKPAPGILVDIYRLDIKGHFDVKTDKNGHYVRLGLPLQGSFLFVFSGPGATPTWMNNLKITQMPVVDITLEPGDGRTLTFDEIQKQIGQQKAGGGGAAAQPPPKAMSAADKAKAEAALKEQDTKLKEAKDTQVAFDQAREHYNAGVELMKTANYQNALSEFEQASTVDPGKHAVMMMLSYRANANLAEAHYQVGVDLFNKKQRPEAKTHFEAAVAAVKKALALAPTDTAENNPNLNNDLVIYYNILAKNVNLLVEYYGAADLVDPTIKEIAKAEALDATNANKWGVLKADMLRSAGRTDDAVAAYKKVIAADPANVDALYGLGLTLIASTERPQIQEGANTLAEFVAKAPPTDKRVAIVKDALEGVKNAYKVEAEKPASPAKGRKKP
jgi:tetratricopeptide (TPR) repeat protein